MIAVIGDSDQAASIGVHKACGFTPPATCKNIGWKFGRWLDTPLMQLRARPRRTDAAAGSDASARALAGTAGDNLH